MHNHQQRFLAFCFYCLIIWFFAAVEVWGSFNPGAHAHSAVFCRGWALYFVLFAVGLTARTYWYHRQHLRLAK